MPLCFTGFLVEVKNISLQTMARPGTRQYEQNKAQVAGKTSAAAEHHRDALSLHSQRKDDQHDSSREKIVEDPQTPHEQALGREKARKRKLKSDFGSGHRGKRVMTDEEPPQNLDIHAPSRSLKTDFSDDEHLRTHERTILDKKTNHKSVRTGGPFWHIQGLIYLEKYLGKRGIITKGAGKLSELKLDGQIEGQAPDDLEEVVKWVKSERNSTESMGLCVPLSAQGKPCTIFAVETATGDIAEEHEKDILEKAAKSHNIQDSLTLVLYYEKGKEKPYKLSAGILTLTKIVYMIDGPGSEFFDCVIRILANKKSLSWVVNESSK